MTSSFTPRDTTAHPTKHRLLAHEWRTPTRRTRTGRSSEWFCPCLESVAGQQAQQVTPTIGEPHQLFVQFEHLKREVLVQA
jgi:hypothetical protein